MDAREHARILDVVECVGEAAVGLLDAEHQVATIKHEDIPGFMHAMTMEYGVRDKQEFAKLHNGDRIDATVFVQGDDYWVGEVHPAPKP